MRHVRRLERVHWTVVIPVRALPEAKSRLLATTADPDGHRRLVEALRADTRAAAEAAGEVARVLLVSDRPGVDPDALVQREPGLNAAVREAAAHAAATWPADGVAVLLGDLPALRPEDLDTALVAAAAHPRAYVADVEGTGTTLLTARPGVVLAPAFGPGSAERHGAGAVRLDAAPGLRRDVDTAAELREARELGVGPATAAVLAGTASTLRSPRDGMMGS